MVTVSENLKLVNHMVSKLLKGSWELRRRSLQSPPWPAYSIPVRTAAETVALPRSKSFCRRAIYETYIDFTLCSEETDELEAEFVALRQKLLLRARATVSAAVRISDSARLGDPRARQIQMFILTATFLIAGFIQLMHQHPRCASM